MFGSRFHVAGSLPGEGETQIFVKTADGRPISLSILNPRRRIFVFHDQVRVRRVERQQLASGQLMIEPVDGAVLQVRERIVARRAGQLVLAQHDLLLPGVHVIRRIRGRLDRKSVV